MNKKKIKYKKITLKENTMNSYFQYLKVEGD